jgi:hypothetical protein
MLDQCRSIVPSDECSMFRLDLRIHWHFSLAEIQWVYYSLLNEQCWIIYILCKVSALSFILQDKKPNLHILWVARKKSWIINYASKMSNLKNGLWIFIATGNCHWKIAWFVLVAAVCKYGLLRYFKIQTLWIFFSDVFVYILYYKMSENHLRSVWKKKKINVPEFKVWILYLSCSYQPDAWIWRYKVALEISDTHHPNCVLQKQIVKHERPTLSIYRL